MRVAEVGKSVLIVSGIVGGNRECVAWFWNSPWDWSGSERTGIPMVLPVAEAAKL